MQVLPQCLKIFNDLSVISGYKINWGKICINDLNSVILLVNRHI